MDAVAKLGSLYVCLIQYALILFFLSYMYVFSYIVLSLFHLITFLQGYNLNQLLAVCNILDK